MNPTDFIRKHIIAALTAEGFAPSVVQGGVAKACSDVQHSICFEMTSGEIS